MGDAAALCVFVAVLISVTLTPAMLSLIGRKVMSKKAWASVDTPEKIAARHTEQEQREESPHGWLKIVLAKPVVTILLCVVALGCYWPFRWVRCVWACRRLKAHRLKALNIRPTRLLKTSLVKA